MKLNKKLALIFTIILSSFAMLLILFNNLFLDKFYMIRKRQTMFDTYNQVVEVVKNNDNADQYSLMMEISDISSSSGSEIIFFNSNGLNMDPRLDSKYRSITDLPIMMNNERLTKEDFDEYISVNGTEINFENQEDSSKNSIGLIGRIVDDDSSLLGYAFIYVSYERIKETVKISNIFILYTILILLAISMVVSYIVSSSLTRPLKDAEMKTRKIAELDFSTKLDTSSKDEIGELAISINKMSDELERSINSLKDANQKLEEDIKLKERINQLREEFISDVSHELKTPISIISGYSEALKLEGLNQDDINNYADIIIDESGRMNKMVRNLLKFTQIEAGFMKLDIEDFNIRDCVDSITRPLELKIKEKQINLKIKVDDIMVKGDFEMIETVFNNFFVNAINYCDNERIIEVKGEIINNKYRITVMNTGITIDPDNQKRIFDSFYKVDKSRSRKYGGSGLGLAIVKSIMENHKNNFGVYNNLENNGVTFYFELDLANTVVGEKDE